MPDRSRHKNYDILNLIGYGLSKFDRGFVECYGFKTKQTFYEYIVTLGIAETTGTVKNRQDLFDGMEPGGPRKGWWQKGPVYKFRKDYIDSLFGNLSVEDFVDVVKLSIKQKFQGKLLPSQSLEKTTLFPVLQKGEDNTIAKPIIQSCFKQMQMTGSEAEYFFLNNYRVIEAFANATIDDARLFGDGYDFQLSLPTQYYLAEVKGLRGKAGQVRMTQKEYQKASEYSDGYALVIVSNLGVIPKMTVFFNPVHKIVFEKQMIATEQVFYRSTVKV